MRAGSLPLSRSEHLEPFRGASDRIREIQGTAGDIAWYEDGAWDPWNHTECAMALNIMGEHDSADMAFAYLAETQKPDGSWLAEYGAAVPMADETHMERGGAPAFHDTNFAAYCAVGVLHHWMVRKDREFLNQYWPVVTRAMAFVLSLQSEHGDILWSAEAGRTEADDAFRAGNSSIYKSLEAAIRLADIIGVDASNWRSARSKLCNALREKPHRFDRDKTDRSGFAMDWYYPVLAGVLTDEESRARIDEQWDIFVEPGQGCRCVSDQPWITVAETCELVMALVSIGAWSEAEALFKTQLGYTDQNGAFWMGWQFEHGAFWPEELPSWTQAAVILAADSLYADTPASKLLVTHSR